MRAAVAGVHVLCEKPLALDLDDARRLAALAHDQGRVLQVGFWRRFAPPWRAAKERIDAGEIGTPVYVRLAQWDGDPPPASFCDPAVSGGLAIDCGVHEYDLAEWLTGRHITVSAWALPLVEASSASGDLNNLLAVLELDDGAVATVDLTRNARFGDDVSLRFSAHRRAARRPPVNRPHPPRGRVGVRELPESLVEDAMAAGVAAGRAFAARCGRAVGVPTPRPAFARAGRPGRDGRGPQSPARRRLTVVAQATAAPSACTRSRRAGASAVMARAIVLSRLVAHTTEQAVGPDDTTARVSGRTSR
jgi:predicted dehydrogenase